jgi:chorismate mutase
MDEIKQLRKKVDVIDEQLLKLLSQRVQVCRSIGSIKKNCGLPVYDADREKELYHSIKVKAEQLCIDPSQVEAIYREIVNMCSAVQQ